MRQLLKRHRAIASLSILAWSGAYSMPAMAQDESGQDWLECFESSAPENLARLMVDDFLATKYELGSAPKPSFRGRFAAVLLPCVIDEDLTEENLPPITNYALRLLGVEGSRERLLEMGISEDFLAKAVAIYRRELAGEDTEAEIKAAVRVESERAGLSEDSVKLLPFLLAMYADSSVALEAGPPSF